MLRRRNLSTSVLKLLLVACALYGIHYLFKEDVFSVKTSSRDGALPDSVLSRKEKVFGKFNENLNFPHIPGREIDLNGGKVIEFIKEDHKDQEEAVIENPIGGEEKPSDSNIYKPYLTWRDDGVGNYEQQYPDRVGPGEYGVTVNDLPSEKDEVDAAIKEYGFNMVNSDKISLDRLPKDLRHQECKHWNYAKDLPTVSVIIVFHNEGWSTLVRTIHSVVNLTPEKFLAEVVLIDDFSSKDHLKQKLADYIQRWNGKVKLFRNERREGLIRARSIGAHKATEGEILIYLDAHCEVGYNWIPPLITPIAMNRKVCTVPLIDVISGKHFTFAPQAGGDISGFARGAWDWSMLWKRIPLTKEERNRRAHTTDPYRLAINALTRTPS